MIKTLYKYGVILSIINCTLFIVLPSGYYMNGDWTIPQGIDQIKIFTDINTWNSKSNFGIPAIESISGLQYRFLYLVLYYLGVEQELITKIIIIIFTNIGGISLLALLNRINNDNKINYLVVGIFISSPVAYNFLTMGWLNFYICYHLLSAYLYLTYQNIEIKYKINLFLKVLVLWFMLIGIQSIAWSVLITLLAGLAWKEWKKEVIVKLVLPYIFLLILTLYWIIPYLINNSYNISFNVNYILNIPESISSDSQFTLSSSLMGWGSLFNSSYENSLAYNFPKGFHFIFMVPVVAVLMNYKKLILNKDSKVFFMAFLILPLFLYSLMTFREYLIYIPGFQIFRQVSRNIAPIILIYAINIGYLMMYLNSKFIKILISFIILISLIISLVPWVRNLSDPAPSSFSQAIIVKKYPDEYFEAEKILNNYVNYRALFLPTGVMHRDYNDTRYVGNFKSFIDTHSAFSNANGAISVGGGRYNPSISIVNKYIGDVFPANSYFINDKYIDIYVIRLSWLKNKNKNIKLLFSEKYFTNIFDGKDLLIFERINKNNIIKVDNKVNSNYKRISNYEIKILDSIKSRIIFNESYSKFWVFCPLDKKVIGRFIQLLNNQCIYSKIADSNNSFGNLFMMGDNFYERGSIIYIMQYIVYISFFISSIIFLILSIVICRNYEKK